MLKGFTNFQDSTITNDVVNNVISFFDYGLLDKGAFINVNIPQTGHYLGSEHVLKRVNDPRYSTRVWASARKNWVWETGIGATQISGIYINGTYYPTSTTGAYSYYIDYPNGTVIFNSAISSGTSITCNYSYKYVNVTRVEGINWFAQLHAKSENPSSDYVAQSGDFGGLPQSRYQLPSIGIELAGRSLKPYQLGGNQWTYTDLKIHCAAEDLYTRDKLIDIVTLQNEKSFYMYDLDQIAASGDYPLDVYGSPISGAKTYPNLVESYKYKILRLYDMKLDSLYSLGNLHFATIKCKTETHLGV